MNDYYAKKLSANNLKQCYDIAPPRTRQYLRAEIEYCLKFIQPHFKVLELGCGYGRVIKPIASKTKLIYGLDSSIDNLKMAKTFLKEFDNCHLICSNAARPGFKDESFDIVLCIQNGISAFHMDKKQLALNALALARRSGKILFSGYTERFWDHRLEWFRLQAEHKLIGEIDETATGNGKIVCRDGFTAETVSPDQFRKLASELNLQMELEEVDGSSLFCIIEKA